MARSPRLRALAAGLALTGSALGVVSSATPAAAGTPPKEVRVWVSAINVASDGDGAFSGAGDFGFGSSSFNLTDPADGGAGATYGELVPAKGQSSDGTYKFDDFQNYALPHLTGKNVLTREVAGTKVRVKMSATEWDMSSSCQVAPVEDLKLPPVGEVSYQFIRGYDGCGINKSIDVIFVVSLRRLA